MFVISILFIITGVITSAYSYPTVEQNRDSFLLDSYEDDSYTQVNLSDYLTNTSESGNYSYEITIYDDGSNSTSSWSDTLNRDDPDGLLCNDESPINVSNQQIKVCSDTVYNPDTDQDDAKIYFKSKDEYYDGVVEVEILDDEGYGTNETMYFGVATQEQPEYSESTGFGSDSNVLPYNTNIQDGINNSQQLLGYTNFGDNQSGGYGYNYNKIEELDYDISDEDGTNSIYNDGIYNNLSLEPYELLFESRNDEGLTINSYIGVSNERDLRINDGRAIDEVVKIINSSHPDKVEFSYEPAGDSSSKNFNISKDKLIQKDDIYFFPLSFNYKKVDVDGTITPYKYNIYIGGDFVYSGITDTYVSDNGIGFAPSLNGEQPIVDEVSVYSGMGTLSAHKQWIESQKRLGYTETTNNITDKVMSEERETYNIDNGFDDVGFIRYEIQKDGEVIDTIRTGYTKTYSSNLDSLDTGDVEFTADFTGESYGDQQYNLEVDNYDNVDETYTINATAYDYYELEPTASQSFTVDTNSTSTQYPPEQISTPADLNMVYEETKSKDIGDIFEDYDDLYVSFDVDDTNYNISSTDSTKSDSMTSDIFDMEFVSSDVIEIDSKTTNYNDSITLTACNDDGCSSTDFTLDISDDVGSPEFTGNLQDISAKGYDKNNEIVISDFAQNYDKVEVRFRDDLNQINNYLTVVNSIDTDSYESEKFGEVRLSRTADDDKLYFTSHNRNHNTPVNITIINSNTGEQDSQEVYLNSSSYDYDDDIKESHKQLVEEPYLLDFRDYMDDKKQESVESVNLSYYVDDSIQSLYVDEVEQESYGSIQDNTTLSMWVEKENVFGDIVWGVGSNVFDYKGWGVDFKPVQLNIKYNDSEYDNENITIDYYVNESSYEDSGGTGGENDSDDDVQEPDDMDTEAPDWFPEPPEDQQLWWAMIVLLGVVGATTLMTPADSFFARASFGVVAGVGVFVLLTAVGWIPLGYLIAFLLIVSLIIGYMFSRLIIGTS